MAAGFRRYLTNFRRKQVARRDRNARVHNHPYWISLPSWLLAAYRRERRGKIRSTKFLNDILWAQYCLFLSVRIQDDLFDGQSKCVPLLLASDQFLIEAERTFSKYLDRNSRFWNFYWRCLETSTRAILDVDRIQRTPTARHQKLLEGYAKVSEIFKVGSAAFCAKFERMDDFPRIARFADEMAIVGQILDDLEDIDEDLQRNRFNYVASVLLPSRPKKTVPRKLLAQIAENLLFNGGLNNILNQVRRHLQLAHEALDPLKIRAARKFIASYQNAVDKMENDLHRQTVSLIFGRTYHMKRKRTAY